MRRLASSIADLANQEVSGDPRAIMRKRAELALATIQSLPWKDETPSVERYQSVVRTLRLGGNCHDRSPALVALLRALRVPGAKMVWDNEPKSDRNHVLVTARTGATECLTGVCKPGWCWMETTINGAKMCEDPYDAARRVQHTSHGIGPVPRGVRLPRATGQSIVTSQSKPSEPVRAAVSTQQRSAVAIPRRASRSAPIGMRSLPRGVMGTVPKGCAPCNMKSPLAIALDAAAAGVAVHMKPSAGLDSDPCAEAWRAYYAARAAFDQPARFPDTGSFALRRSGGMMSNPAGASTGFTIGEWRSMPIIAHRERLQSALRAWAARISVPWASIDTGSLYDWLNVATIDLDSQGDSLATQADAALDAYRSCRASGGVDAAAVIRLSGSSCVSWGYAALGVKRAIIRGYLAVGGYDIGLGNDIIDAMERAVSRHCDMEAARKTAVASAPNTTARAAVLRR